MILHQIIFYLFETCINGTEADDIISKLRFDNLYRVQVVEFFGGIWVIWKDFVRLLSTTKWLL